MAGLTDALLMVVTLLSMEELIKTWIFGIENGYFRRNERFEVNDVKILKATL